MSTKTFCDRCGIEIKDRYPENTIHGTLTIRRIRGNYGYDSWWEEGPLDICHGCLVTSGLLNKVESDG
jgi:hypothetical protein